MIYQHRVDPTLFIDAFRYTVSPELSPETRDFLERRVRQFSTQNYKGQLFYIFDLPVQGQLGCRNGDWLGLDETGRYHAFANDYFAENFVRAIPAGAVIH